MKIDKDKRRMRAIKSRIPIFPTKCMCCGEEYAFEKMWFFYRYGVNRSCHEWYFCQKCMHSKEEVLHEIDTDEVIFGIVGVDDFNSYKKKDYTRMNEEMEKAFPPVRMKKE